MRQMTWLLWVAALTGCAAPRNYPKSDHCDGQRFLMPGIKVTRGLGDVLKWQLFDAKTPWPKSCPARAIPAPARPDDADAVVVTFIGHATHLIEHRGQRILTDPIFSQRASPVSWAGPKRLCAPGIAIDKLPHIDVVVISHNHYDHLDLPSLLQLAQAHHPIFIVPLGTAHTLTEAGIDQVSELDWYTPHTVLEPPICITPTPAQHWTMRGLRDRNDALWAGYVIEMGPTRLFFAGDTGFGPHFKAIAQKLGPIDLALLPIGAYSPRWFMAPQHMDPSQAVQAFIDVGAAQAIATHYGTFQLANEGLEAPATELHDALRRRQLPQTMFIAPQVGESFRWRLPSQAQLRPALH